MSINYAADQVASAQEDEYETLREEMLHADDQTVQLTGFTVVAAGILASAVEQAKDLAPRLLLLVGFNVVVLTLVIRIREKRTVQGRIAAYLRVFHEPGTGWETRLLSYRKHDGGRRKGSTPSPRSSPQWKRFDRLLGELVVFMALSLLSVLGTALTLSTAATPAPAWLWTIILGVQVVVLGLICWLSQSLKQLRVDSEEWQSKWLSMQAIEELVGDRLILVNGPPAVGKTTFARALARELSLPMIPKDQLKESMHDQLELQDPRTLTDLTPLDELDDAVTKILLRIASGSPPMIVEANFRAHQVEELRNSGQGVIEVFLHASGITLERRYLSRSTSNERHQVHVPVPEHGDLGTEKSGGHQPLGLGLTIEVDMDDSDIPHDQVVKNGVQKVLRELIILRAGTGQRRVGGTN